MTFPFIKLLDPCVTRCQLHFRGFWTWKYFRLTFFAATNVLILSLWPKTYKLPFLHIPGVPFASKVVIFKLVMLFHKYLIWRQALFLNLMQSQKNYSTTLLLFDLVLKMSTNHHIWKVISSCPIFVVKPSGNVSSWVNVLSCDSVVKIMVIIGKGQGQHVFAVSLNHQNDLKYFFARWTIIGKDFGNFAILHFYCSIGTKIGYLNMFQYRQ